MAPVLPAAANRSPLDELKSSSTMSALFNFQSLCLVIILTVCTCTYVHAVFPGILDRNRDGFFGLFWKCARIGERLSPYVSLCCILMALWYLVG